MKKYLFILLVCCGVQELIMQAGGACSSMGNSVRPPSSPRASSYEVHASENEVQYTEITDFQAHAANSSIEPTKMRDSDEESNATAESSPSEGTVLAQSIAEPEADPFEVEKELEKKKKEEAAFVLASLKKASRDRHTKLSNGTARRLTLVLQSKPTPQLHILHSADTVIAKPKNVDVFRAFKDAADALATHREETEQTTRRKISGADEDKRDGYVAPAQAPIAPPAPRPENPTSVPSNRTVQASKDQRGSLVVWNLD